MRQTRAKYWSLSPVAYYIKNKLEIKNLHSGTMKEWHEWKLNYKSAHPNWYWITEEAFDKLQDIVFFIPDIYNDIRYFIKNKFVSKTHYIKTGLKPGVYWDLDTKILHGLFTELVDFVEIEKAWMLIAWDKEAAKKYKTPFWSKGIFRFGNFRSAEAGLEYLNWEASLEDNAIQSTAAREIMFLYDWWKNIRPNRLEIYEYPSYVSAFKDRDLSEEITEEQKEALNDTLKLEEKYNKEDEDMLISLIKIRKSLWT